MNKYLKENISLILRIFLYLQPIIDLVTGIMINYFNINITIGMIIRFVFLLFIIYFYLFVKKDVSKYKKYYLISILLFVIGFIIVTIINKDINVLSYEISQMLKVLYFPLLLSLIDFNDLKIKINDIVNLGIIYMVLIAIPNILNISYNSYTQGKVGSVGLFNSGNEISAILSIITPFLIYYLFNKNSIYKKILIIFLIGYTFFSMGSKIVIISLLLSLIFNIYLYIKNNKVDKNKLLFGSIILVVLVIIGIVILPKTNFYYNIKLHLDFLGIHSINDIFSYNFLNRFVFSDRLTFLLNTNMLYLNSSFLEKLFGIGYVMNYATDIVTLKTIEMDFFDIFYHVGIIGLVLFIIPLLSTIKNIFKNKNTLIIFTLLLSLLISFLVGHTLTAPSVSLILIFVLKYNKR